MAIVRMVNGISDKAQKGRVATSVAHNAAAAGRFLQPSIFASCCWDDMDLLIGTLIGSPSSNLLSQLIWNTLAFAPLHPPAPVPAKA